MHCRFDIHTKNETHLQQPYYSKVWEERCMLTILRYIVCDQMLNGSCRNTNQSLACSRIRRWY